MERLSVWIQSCGFVPTQGFDDFGGGIGNQGTLTLTNSTVSGNSATSGSAILSYDSASSEPASVTLSNNLVDGECDGVIVSGGYNLESPGNTCGFNQTGDQRGEPRPETGGTLCDVGAFELQP